jgi:hypothetical protein
MSIFLLGMKSHKPGKHTVDKILRKFGLDENSKHLVRNDKDLLEINTYEADGFIIFPYTLQRFAPLIYLAETEKPIIIVSEKHTFQNALETYDYLSDHSNVQLVFSPTELRTKVRALKMIKWLNNVKVCLFDAGQWQLDGIVWQRNPLFHGKLDVRNVYAEELLKAVNEADRIQAQRLARKWIRKSRVIEPTFEDITKTARVYLAMKTIISDMNAKAAYVLWCGQFTKPLEAKMCFALAKLADDGVPVGCWRGGNLLPMLMLHSVSGKQVFTPEALSNKGKIIRLKHCFAPTKMAETKCILRRWRSMEGTVTGFVKLPEGTVTLINCGVGDRMVITKARVIDCKNLGGENCRMTVSVELENEETTHKFVGREFALVYGDYAKEAGELAKNLGIGTL